VNVCEQPGAEKTTSEHTSASGKKSQARGPSSWSRRSISPAFDGNGVSTLLLPPGLSEEEEIAIDKDYPRDLLDQNREEDGGSP
jgi:hypothetical protein